MRELWPWLTLLGLGAYHGINPAMGWLFAVALGLHRRRRAVVLQALAPLALGHAAAIVATLAAVAALGRVLDATVLRTAAGALLFAWGLYHVLRRPPHPVRVGMRAGFAALLLWSFVMALAHGAGLMLVPVFYGWPAGMAGFHGPLTSASLAVALAAVGVHTLAMLALTGAVAIAVYEWVGLAVLRKGWINLDWLWAAALVAAGAVLILA